MNDTGQKWDRWIVGLFLAIGAIIGGFLISVFYGRLTADPKVDIVREVRIDYDGRSRTVELNRDTVLTITPNEYARVLTELREQNRFLNDLITIVVTSLTFAGGAAAFFMWRLQSKYEKYSNHQEELEKTNKECLRKADESYREHEKSIDEKADKVRETYDSIQVQQSDLRTSIAAGEVVVSKIGDASNNLDKVVKKSQSMIDELKTAAGDVVKENMSARRSTTDSSLRVSVPRYAAMDGEPGNAVSAIAAASKAFEERTIATVRAAIVPLENAIASTLGPTLDAIAQEQARSMKTLADTAKIAFGGSPDVSRRSQDKAQDDSRAHGAGDTNSNKETGQP